MNSDTIKIGIIGIGGIGGFVGAPLAKKYKDSTTKIIFICRGDTKKAIQNEGLLFESKGTKETIFPDLVSDNPTEIGILDVLILTCKSYSISSILATYQDCINDETVIITLQNVVNAREIIRETLPKTGKIMEGCIYVASNVKKPGHIQHVGGPGKIFVGGNEDQSILNLLAAGGLDITHVANINEILWKKYLFVAPVAAITSAYKVTFGQLLEDSNLMEILENMMMEIQSLASKNNINLTNEDIKTSKELLTKFPFESKSSLQLDFENQNQTEKPFLVDYVIEKAAQYGIETPFYNRINSLLL
ncbi:2-dehydropantoate 2-reductase [Flavobacterium circumlabens]|uniref:2-dehydropantoate 2-reductase n=1 Tax=Flavobacterium circumlabens TaxID=2133765 RepID=A0A4Y7UAA4_9FLAO|nr:2-dehydropantoate 2-reductase [Flavobacterium circumlabens]TCN54559.1 2-dehydropantoate 2-reductase [Flavobacterium circumlabens]TEB42759.1 2-dehydropantoate 2-reductase [Flavobacterium circumlabens]